MVISEFVLLFVNGSVEDDYVASKDLKDLLLEMAESFNKILNKASVTLLLWTIWK